MPGCCAWHGTWQEDVAKSSFRRNGTFPPRLLDRVRSQDPMPLESLEREETFGQLRRVLEQLPNGDREILTSRYGLNYDTPRIACR